MDLFQNYPESWHDFGIDKIIIDYEDVLVFLDIEAKVIIKCSEYIYFSSFAHWDENVLKAISIDENAPIINNTLNTITERYGKNILGGGTKKLSDKYYCIRFEFIDDNIFEIVCKSHTVIT